MKFFVKNSVGENAVIQGLLWLLRFVIIGSALWSLISFDWQSFFLALLAYVLSFIPEFIEYRFRAVLPVEFDFAIALFIFLSVFLGEVGDVYERFFWWDAILHLSSSFMLGYIAFLWLYIKLQQEKIESSPKIQGLIIFCVAVALGAIWEIFEFMMDQLFGFNMQKSGLIDTMWDLIVNAIGALAIASIGVLCIKNGGVGPIRNLTHAFMSQNKLWKR